MPLEADSHDVGSVFGAQAVYLYSDQVVVRLKSEECADLNFTSRLLAARLWEAISAKASNQAAAASSAVVSQKSARKEIDVDSIDSFLQQLRGVPALQLHGGGHLPGSTLLGSLAEWTAANSSVASGTGAVQCVLFLEGADTLSASVLSGVLRLLREHRGLTAGTASAAEHLPVSVVFSISAPAEVFHSRLHRTAAQCVRITNVHLLNPLVTLDVLLHTALVRGVLPLTPPPRAVKWALSHALAWNLSLTSMVQRLAAYGVLAARGSQVFSLSGPLPQPVFLPVHCVLAQELFMTYSQNVHCAKGVDLRTCSALGLVRALEGHVKDADAEALKALFSIGNTEHTAEGILPVEAVSCLWFAAMQRAAAVPHDLFAAVVESQDWQSYRRSCSGQWERDGVPSAEIKACHILAESATAWLASGRAVDAPAAAAAAAGSRELHAAPRRKTKGARNTAPQTARGIRRVISDFMLAPDAPALSIVQTPALWPAGFTVGVDSAPAVLTPATRWLALPTEAVCCAALAEAGGSEPEHTPKRGRRRGGGGRPDPPPLPLAGRLTATLPTVPTHLWTKWTANKLSSRQIWLSVLLCQPLLPTARSRPWLRGGRRLAQTYRCRLFASTRRRCGGCGGIDAGWPLRFIDWQ